MAGFHYKLKEEEINRNPAIYLYISYLLQPKFYYNKMADDIFNLFMMSGHGLVHIL